MLHRSLCHEESVKLSSNLYTVFIDFQYAVFIYTYVWDMSRYIAITRDRTNSPVNLRFNLKQIATETFLLPCISIRSPYHHIKNLPLDSEWKYSKNTSTCRWALAIIKNLTIHYNPPMKHQNLTNKVSLPMFKGAGNTIRWNHCQLKLRVMTLWNTQMSNHHYWKSYFSA